jgi:hypothetical protein
MKNYGVVCPVLQQHLFGQKHTDATALYRLLRRDTVTERLKEVVERRLNVNRSMNELNLRENGSDYDYLPRSAPARKKKGVVYFKGE